MARVFTINFTFQGNTYNAFVEYKSSEEELFYNVHVNDPSVQKLLPRSRLRYWGSDGYKDLDIPNPLTEKLVDVIATAIEGHLSKAEKELFNRNSLI
ncbi:MAG TPA: hypothetical protein VGE66_17275 [Chitinophagaceae bacterium]